MSCHGSQTPGPSGAAPRVLGKCQEGGSTFGVCGLGPRDRNGSLKPVLGASWQGLHPQQVGKVRQDLRSAGGRRQPGMGQH